MLASCTTPSQPPPPAEQAPPPPAFTDQQLSDWLYAADQALNRDHLTYPREGSAFEIYQQILHLQPNQEDATRGLERIVERYVAFAMAALERRQFASARSNLARARIILPDHPSIEPSAAQIRLIVEADRELVELNQKDLAAENTRVTQALQQLVNSASGDNCRYLINARNDGQGRWIYQQLSRAHTDARLRAQIQIRLPASVERLCF